MDEIFGALSTTSKTDAPSTLSINTNATVDILGKEWLEESGRSLPPGFLRAHLIPVLSHPRFPGRTVSISFFCLGGQTIGIKPTLVLQRSGPLFAYAPVQACTVEFQVWAWGKRRRLGAALIVRQLSSLSDPSPSY